MEYFKLQLGCLTVLLYIAVIYIKECKEHHVKRSKSIFWVMLILAVVSVVLDGATAWTVNHLDIVNPILNLVLHVCFLISLDTVVAGFFIYMLRITGYFPKSKRMKVLLFSPYFIAVIVAVGFSGSLEYVQGSYTNYSRGITAYICFVIVAVYLLLSAVVFALRWNYIEKNKRASILTYLLFMTAISAAQMIVPEILISSLAPTIFIVGIYMNQEDPAHAELARHQSNMVENFATLIEKRDNNTGGHIKRTSRYVGLIAEEMRKRGYYKKVLTKDYISNLLKAAPMHDIGKISVPDAILQKPGKLTPEEYEVMKKHSENGGKIILEVFGNFGSEEYRKMAYQVARYHHEKWNGKGYPEGLKRKEIPLCARIMAVADVFDAISEKRCYRDAMPLDKCFEIIENGSGQDFDPLIAEIFLDIRDKVEEVHREFVNEAENAEEISVPALDAEEE